MEKTKKIRLSVVLAVYNEEQNLRDCLFSVSDFADEIVIVDGGSTDKTLDIAKRFHATIIETDNPPMFHINKQKGLDAAKGEWILQLDADEVVTPMLRDEILDRIKDEEIKSKKINSKVKPFISHHVSLINGFYIPRKNFFWGMWIKKGGQYPDYVMRLVRNGKAYFPCKSIHEQIIVDGQTAYLKEPMLHYSYKTTKDYWKKADAYTTLTAQELLEKQTPLTFQLWFKYVVVKPFSVFFLIYVRHKAFLHGWRGFIFSYWSSKSYAIAWKKYRDLVKNQIVH